MQHARHGYSIAMMAQVCEVVSDTFESLEQVNILDTSFTLLDDCEHGYKLQQSRY